VNPEEAIRITARDDSGRRVYYRYYSDGLNSRPVNGCKFDALVVDRDAGVKVVSQLHAIGWTDYTIVRADLDRVHDKDCERFA